jgi:hypothetical protein
MKQASAGGTTSLLLIRRPVIVAVALLIALNHTRKGINQTLLTLDRK